MARAAASHKPPTKAAPAPAKAAKAKAAKASAPAPRGGHSPGQPQPATDSHAPPLAPAKGGPAPRAAKAPAPAKGGKLAAAKAKAAKAGKAEDAAEPPQAVTVAMKEAAKPENQRKKGTRLPPVVVAVNSAKEIPWKQGEYAVFINEKRYSCIRVGLGAVIHFIPMTAKALRVHKQDAKRFEDNWMPYQYPLKRAAEIFAEGAKIRGISTEARDHLARILDRSLDHLKIAEDDDMATKKAAAKAETPAEADAGITTTTVVAGKKVKVEKGAPKPSPKEATAEVRMMSRDDAAKAIKAGGKLKVGRDNDTRKNSLRWTAIETIRKCKTVDEALKAKFKFKGIVQEVKFTDVRSAVRRGYVVILRK